MKEYEGSFIAKDDSGNEYEISIYVDILDAGSFSEPDATIEGLRSLMTDEGHHVNRIAKGKYKIVQTNVLIYSDDPNSP